MLTLTRLADGHTEEPAHAKFLHAVSRRKNIIT